MKSRWFPSGALSAAICLWWGGAALALDGLAPPTWSAPAAADVKAELDAWLGAKQLDDVQREQISALWPETEEEPAGLELLERVVTTLAAADPGAKEIVTFVRSARGISDVPQSALLTDNSLPPVVRNNLRLYLGIWLAQHDMHEEALEQFADMAANDVVAPAALLFYRSVCHHRLRDKEQCLPAIAMLLENEEAVPRRFREVARLMQADLEPLKEDTLDEVARLMDSVRRRLDLARVGQRVQKEEDEVIAKLDKMIEELEKQRQQMQQSASAQSGQSPATPLPDSQAAGGRGKGDVDPKDLKNQGNWGNLPPKERQEALQQISKELPAHYREAIEEYFRKIAREGNK